MRWGENLINFRDEEGKMILGVLGIVGIVGVVGVVCPVPRLVYGRRLV
jgi:hypothetical protein